MSSDRCRPGPDLTERRAARRIAAHQHPIVPGQVRFTAGDREGNGLIEDISVTGAHISEAAPRLEPGTKVDLYFLQESTPRRIHAIAEVVRETPSGFAVRFIRLERELESLVISAAAKPELPNR